MLRYSTLGAPVRASVLTIYTFSACSSDAGTRRRTRNTYRCHTGHTRASPIPRPLAARVSSEWSPVSFVGASGLPWRWNRDHDPNAIDPQWPLARPRKQEKLFIRQLRNQVILWNNDDGQSKNGFVGRSKPGVCGRPPPTLARATHAKPVIPAASLRNAK